MSSLYKRATLRQAVVLRMIEGAVRNAAHAHPGGRIDDESIAPSISKRAAGTLTAAWPAVLAAPRVRSDGAREQRHSPGAADAGQTFTGAGNTGVLPFCHDRRGASRVSWRAPVRLLHRAIGNACSDARRAGQTERLAALVDVLRLMGALLESDQAPDPRQRLFMPMKES